MKRFTYNDTEFGIERVGTTWEIRRGEALVAAGLFPELSDGVAEAKAVALIRTIHPVGVKVVGPDVTHPLTVGDIRYVGPDIAHPNFVSWDKDSPSFPKQL